MPPDRCTVNVVKLQKLGNSSLEYPASFRGKDPVPGSNDSEVLTQFPCGDADVLPSATSYAISRN